jgi:fumarylacetoacetate (FAA) hydrolase
MAGTVIGSGTVSNNDLTKGFSCIIEKRVVEIIETGTPVTEFMRFGDRVRIEMVNDQGLSLFGAIKQEVQPCR